MQNHLFTATAVLAASALVKAASNQASGRAIVQNECDYDVYIFDVPAAGEGGSEQTSGALHKGQTWSQPWTGLTSASGSHDGWSIKISKTDAVTDDILQYEYTYQPTVNDDLVWLDLSSVNGLNNPWITDGWTLTSSESCGSSLLQGVSYLNPDDNTAMQPACPATADLTVVLCKKPDGSSSSTSSAVATSTSTPAAVSIPNPVTALSSILSSVLEPQATTTSAAAPTTTSVAPTTTSTAHSSAHGVQLGPDEFAANKFEAKVATPTTFATAVSTKAEDFFGHTVVEVETAFVTSYVTADGPEPTQARKRHEHHPAHHHEA